MLHLLTLQSETRLSVVHRVVAKLVDLAFVLFLAVVIPYPIGPIFGFIYSLLADCLYHPIFVVMIKRLIKNEKIQVSLIRRLRGMRGRSLGKVLFKLRVVNVHSGKPAQLRESVLRNAPVGIATFFGIIPVWGWFILVIIGLPLMIMEIYLMMSIETGHRLGDVMGDTAVVHYLPEKNSSQEIH